MLKRNGVNKEYENVYFEDFWDLYLFDMSLKKVTLFKILDIESRLRSSIAYNFASVYCTTIADTMKYTDPTCYKAPNSSDKHMTNIFNSFDLFRQTQYTEAGQVKRTIVVFYMKMLLKKRKIIADKAFAKMGRKRIGEWLKL